jgi:general transcription factor 3C polypeptide 5 (transcription factor C subunit 1)
MAEFALPSKKLILVEFPGCVKDGQSIPHRALATFGGGVGLEKALSIPGTMLPLNFRPDEPQSHPIFGDFSLTNGLVLKVKQKKGDPGKFESEMVGQIRSAYRFSGMADFQFSCPGNTGSTAEYGEMCSAIQGENHDDDFDNYIDVARMIDEGPNEALELIPPIFSKVDQVQDYGFKQTLFYLYREDQTEADTGKKRIHRVARLVKQKKHTLVLKWGDSPIPSENPSALSAAEIWKDSILYLTELFNSRPIWSALALKCCTPLAQQRHLKAVHLVSYHYLSGPFRRCWVRLGYDPRTDIASRYLQV